MDSSESTPVFFTSDLGCEVGIGSFGRFFLPGSHHEIFPIPELSSVDHLKTTLIFSLQEKFPKGITLYMFGDFFLESSILEVLGCVEGLRKAWVYTFDQKIRSLAKDTLGKAIWTEPCEHESGRTPFEAAVSFALNHRERNDIDGFMLQQHADFIRLLDDRALGRNADDAQCLFSGLHEMAHEDKINLDEKIYRVFCGKFDFAKLMEVGTTIMKNLRRIAHERALNNSRPGKFQGEYPVESPGESSGESSGESPGESSGESPGESPGEYGGGITYVVTEAPELVNVTHEEVKKAHPNVQVTICTKFVFENGKPDRVRHSFRSWDKKVSAKKIVGKLGGGSDTAAGGEVEIDVKIDY